MASPTSKPAQLKEPIYFANRECITAKISLSVRLSSPIILISSMS